MIDKLIGIVEAKLEASLNDVEELIIKNNYDLKIAKQDVLELRAVLKDPVLTAPVKIISEDLRFFKKMVGKKEIEEKPILSNDLDALSFALGSQPLSSRRNL